MQDAINDRLNQNYDAGFTTKVESDTLPPGLDEDVVRKISKIKNEPKWLLDFRLKAYDRLGELRCKSYRLPSHKLLFSTQERSGKL